MYAIRSYYVFLWSGKTYFRKGLEAYFTILIETLWDKRRILEVYLNIAEFGDGVYGVKAASQQFWKKPPANLTMHEAALLAAVLPNPKKLVITSYSIHYTKLYDVARMCKHVIGVEFVEDAIADARINSEINGITNTEFYAGDMKEILNREFLARHGKPDVIITDPPRAGMHLDVINTILEADAPKVVYVSCNPATQARDLELMAHKYKITRVQPVDMFPHTAHVENIVLLEKI